MTVTSNITNAQLAAQIQALITSWQTRETQMIAWLAGAAGGGDFSNGTYPLSDAFGNVKYVESPAQMGADVTTTVDSATAQATASAASATAASAAQAAALTARNLASTYAANAAASATQAANSQSAAASSAASALASKNSATASATAAVASASSMGTSVTDSAAAATAAAASASAASASASAAAVSATQAATFNPALYATLTGATFSGDITFISQGKVLAGPNGTGLNLNWTDGLTYLDSQNGVTIRGTGGSVVLASFGPSGTFTATTNIVCGSGGAYYTHTGAQREALLDSNDGFLRLNNSQDYVDGLFTPGNMRVDGLLYTSLSGSNNAFLHHTGGHASGAITISTAAPSGGSDGDIWIQH